MTTYNVKTMPNGDVVETRTNPGVAPMVFINGVLQADNIRSAMRNEWESTRTWIPRRINQRWYWPGQVVYRHFTLSPGGGFWVYGDEFDVLKGGSAYE